jgi:hypothetical protein
MTDVAYLCSNCGSVHEVESIRHNLILDLRTAASYELSGHRRMLHPSTRFLRWRVTRGLARALWPVDAPPVSHVPAQLADAQQDRGCPRLVEPAQAQAAQQDSRATSRVKA